MPYADPEKQKQYNKNYQKIWRSKYPLRIKEITKKYRDTHKEEKAARDKAAYSTEKRWVLNLKTKFKITPERYFEKLAEQNNACAICGKLSEEKLQADHDHSTGRFRGLLCGNCNRGLGMFKDDRYSLNKAVEYLTKNQNGN